MRRGFLAVTIAVLLGGAGAASAQIYAPASLDRYFRLEWQATRGVKGPAIEGFRASVPEAASYRVRVLSFDWTGRGGR